MSAGELRHYVAIESLSFDGSSSSGDYSAEATWSNVDYVWARIKYATGREDSDDRDATQKKGMIKIRWRSDVTSKMRITFNSVVFDIEDVFDPTGKKEYLMIPFTVSDGR